ncbi:bifunctional adenosylcobinamide kinase/adenosylcobinamide-phosphate guanylyltransferase [Hyphomicrobium sp.]|jgi:adenosylcobinamide kinase/adenosylcobinamide-phosphate guanylyltransferase|uniref:bifunctional adenosylcobinamide kinase/adenosylcobinamide-phosphate guanylyltransferase n=1 Tax=Hyphomicrobium sp. TaxID=82 RepID=UPI002C041E3E|nr:bifunctional adenosylcobinamide kinase/adenosylcobinamide-phosphate guanylyltransferase [Hyphomicrobium sp.]HVZ03340.1 bifunctional adenosylcobinamide kinase/adenosylcobinamide-phosphate guanylyltransferase [Hyphomicrobium sp.]
MTAANIPPLTLVLGGARSGKSVYAESLLTALPPPWAYVATAEPFDDEMRQRIDIHQRRRGTGWVAHEAPFDLARVLAGKAVETPCLIDCLTLWVSNLILADRDIVQETETLIAALSKRAAPCIMVSNEVGLGIVPDNALARRFRDEAGRLNQRIAAVADRVVFVAAGLPMNLKG